MEHEEADAKVTPPSGTTVQDDPGGKGSGFGARPRDETTGKSNSLSAGGRKDSQAPTLPPGPSADPEG